MAAQAAITPSEPVLVVGGRGKTGRRLADPLRARGNPVRIGTRRGTPPFDSNDHTTWPAALRGVRAAYVTYYPPEAGHYVQVDEPREVAPRSRRRAEHEPMTGPCPTGLRSAGRTGLGHSRARSQEEIDSTRLTRLTAPGGDPTTRLNARANAASER